MDYKEKAIASAKEVFTRDILHKTTAILHGRGKVVTLREHADEDECVTDVRKNFIYVASDADHEEKQGEPQVHIEKSYDSVTRDEKFNLRVKGFFYVNHHRRLARVGYRHTLKINLHWKVKSPIQKKPMTITAHL